MAVLDAATVLHTRAFSTGPLYDHLRDVGLTPEQAHAAFLKEHRIADKPRVSYSAITKGGRTIAQSRMAEALIVYSRLINWYRSGKGHLRIAAPVRFRADPAGRLRRGRAQAAEVGRAVDTAAASDDAQAPEQRHAAHGPGQHRVRDTVTARSVPPAGLAGPGQQG